MASFKFVYFTFARQSSGCFFSSKYLALNWDEQKKRLLRSRTRTKGTPPFEGEDSEQGYNSLAEYSSIMCEVLG